MRKGFTLVELLVVIAIIAVLIGLLLPVLATSREKARQTACLSNLQQVAMAVLQYSQDWDDTLPMSGYEAVDASGKPCFVSVGSAISPFIGDKRILACPSEPMAYDTSGYVESLGITGGECNSGKEGGGSYALNDAVLVSGDAPHLKLYAQKPVRLSELRYPSETVLGYDGNVAGSNQCNFRQFAPAIEGRHLGTCNACFADGHAKALPTFPSGCIAQNINGKVLTEYCLGKPSPYSRRCGQASYLQCVNQLTGVVGRDEMGNCFMRLR
ncbi:MAG: type II secretion system GspH family protein [Armatimonadetes bacterium]|nr:type II secretion system GspH family protein [Armatimonadota bacterium]MDW8028819.1 type II secretion system protein [Armatimonadota bacterium]